MSIFVLGSDDRIEYAELDHKLHSHAAPPPSLDTVLHILQHHPRLDKILVTRMLEQEIDHVTA